MLLFSKQQTLFLLAQCLFLPQRLISKPMAVHFTLNSVPSCGEGHCLLLCFPSSYMPSMQRKGRENSPLLPPLPAASLKDECSMPLGCVVQPFAALDMPRDKNALTQRDVQRCGQCYACLLPFLSLLFLFLKQARVTL